MRVGASEPCERATRTEDLGTKSPDQMWMRWTLPRYRYDQLMEFGWKWRLPAAPLHLLITAFIVIYFGF